MTNIYVKRQSLEFEGS